MDDQMADDCLEITNLKIGFGEGADFCAVLSDVCLTVRPAEIVAIVGESGSGKTLTALSILRLLPVEARVTAGRIRLLGNDILTLSSAGLRGARGRDAAMIFQDPGESLNPVLTVGDQLAKVITLHHRVGGAVARRRARELLGRVGIADPAIRFHAFPHQLSGGTQQRVMIATALACSPRLLIADEPTSALDVTIQAEILDLLNDLRTELGMAILLITHDLAVVNEIADRVAVMYAGTIVEEGRCQDVLRTPRHPYTQGLLKAALSTNRHRQRLFELQGTPFAPGDRTEGCRFASRCKLAMGICAASAPHAIAVAEEHLVRCHAIEQESHT